MKVVKSDIPEIDKTRIEQLAMQKILDNRNRLLVLAVISEQEQIITANELINRKHGV